MDIVTKIHLLPSSGIDREVLDDFVERLVRTIYPEVDDVITATGNPSAENVNVIQIKVPLDEATKHQLEIALKQFFLQDFQVSFVDTSMPLNRKAEIEEATVQFDRELVEGLTKTFVKRKQSAEEAAAARRQAELDNNSDFADFLD